MIHQVPPSLPSRKPLPALPQILLIVACAIIYDWQLAPIPHPRSRPPPLPNPRPLPATLSSPSRRRQPNDLNDYKPQTPLDPSSLTELAGKACLQTIRSVCTNTTSPTRPLLALIFLACFDAALSRSSIRQQRLQRSHRSKLVGR